MSDPINRRTFTTLSAGFVLGSAADLTAAEPAQDPRPAGQPGPPPGPVEAAFERDYPAPKFNPAWKRPQINRLLVQDFVIYAHSDLAMTAKLLEKEPALLHSHMDWGGGDWESGLGAAAHMGRRDIAEFLLGKGARIDIFCAAMLGQLEVVKGLLAAFPNLIDARGPHGISLHAHAKTGGKQAEPVLDYLQSVKKVEFPAPKKPAEPPKKD
jgi:hypothetical protein